MPYGRQHQALLRSGCLSVCLSHAISSKTVHFSANTNRKPRAGTWKSDSLVSVAVTGSCQNGHYIVYIARSNCHRRGHIVSPRDILCRIISRKSSASAEVLTCRLPRFCPVTGSILTPPPPAYISCGLLDVRWLVISWPVSALAATPLWRQWEMRRRRMSERERDNDVSSWSSTRYERTLWLRQRSDEWWCHWIDRLHSQTRIDCWRIFYSMVGVILAHCSVQYPALSPAHWTVQLLACNCWHYIEVTARWYRQYLSVCLSVREHISETTKRNFTKFYAHSACGHDSVFFWPCSKKLYISGCMDDIVFSHKGPNGIV